MIHKNCFRIRLSRLVLTVAIAINTVSMSGVSVFASDDISETVTEVSVPSGNDDVIAPPFIDIDKDDWFYDDVSYAWYIDVMNGISSDIFAPNMSTTRATIVTFLWRLAGKPSAELEVEFGDVEDSAWYADAVGWAASNGLALGYGDGSFGPKDSITREQMAVILYRYVQMTGDVSSDVVITLDYVDTADISAYAYEAICYMTENGIIGGLPGNVLDPKGVATRAQVAAILHRFNEKVIIDD